jgi:hypothetical protein
MDSKGKASRKRVNIFILHNFFHSLSPGIPIRILYPSRSWKILWGKKRKRKGFIKNADKSKGKQESQKIFVVS